VAPPRDGVPCEGRSWGLPCPPRARRSSAPRARLEEDVGDATPPQAVDRPGSDRVTPRVDVPDGVSCAPRAVARLQPSPEEETPRILPTLTLPDLRPAESA
jgi:hypothetical protein